MRAAPSNGTCAALERATPPTAGRLLAHLVDRSKPPPVWGGPTVVVVAHWNEDLTWLRSGGFAELPRVLYQRKDPNAPYYSPNFGFEAGVFLQFIVEHYDALPEQVVVLQGDPGENGLQSEPDPKLQRPNPIRTRGAVTGPQSDSAEGSPRRVPGCCPASPCAH